ncbi:MAG: alpha/beta fold hydrolase, partial [Ktedonobacterales bacterium]|nr:alpha/beta fold hydrolase [Ktedonobacterales bacterium]
PDLCGNGYSGGMRGDYPVPLATANLVDAALWARQRFDGPLYLMGISLGGALAYYAAAAGAPVAALSCVDLFLFDDPQTLRQFMPDARMARLLPALRLLAEPFGWVRIPVEWVRRMDQIVPPEHEAALIPWKLDPLPPRSLTLRTLASAIASPPAVALEDNTVPALVINQEGDAILPPAVTRANYDRLGGPKRYLALSGSAHWSLDAAFYDRLANESDAWFRQHRPAPSFQPTTLNGMDVGEE